MYKLFMFDRRKNRKGFTEHVRDITERIRLTTRKSDIQFWCVNTRCKGSGFSMPAKIPSNLFNDEFWHKFSAGTQIPVKMLKGEGNE